MGDLAAYVSHFSHRVRCDLTLDTETPVGDVSERMIREIDTDILSSEGRGSLLRVGEACGERIRPGAADRRSERNRIRRSEREEIRDEGAGTEIGRGVVQTIVRGVEDR